MRALSAAPRTADRPIRARVSDRDPSRGHLCSGSNTPAEGHKRTGSSTRKQGRPLSDVLSHALSPVSASAPLAVALGLVAGAALLWLTKRASTFLTPEDPALGMAKVLALTGLGLVLAASSLSLLHLFARPAVLPFGVAMAASFLLVATYHLFRFGGVAAVSGRRR